MGCHRERYQQLISDDKGQSTVEYAVVLGALLCIVLVIGALGNVEGDGLFVRHAALAASHHIQGAIGGAVDVFCY